MIHMQYKFFRNIILDTINNDDSEVTINYRQHEYRHAWYM